MASLALKILKAFLLILNAAVYVATLGINFTGIQRGLFNSTNATNITNYDLNIIPPPWTFYIIWGIIYINAAIFIIYSIVNIFRKTPTGRLFYSPDIITAWFLIAYIGNWICNSAWIFVAEAAERSMTFLPPMALFLWLIFICLTIALVFSYRALDKEARSLKRYGLTKDIWLIRILLQNGSSFYATWAAIASSINVGFNLHYLGGINKELAETAVLLIIAIMTLGFVSADIGVLDRWTRYTVTPYCVLVLALTGSLISVGVDRSRNSIFVLILLVASALGLMAKVVLMIVHSVSDKRKMSVEVSEETNFCEKR